MRTLLPIPALTRDFDRLFTDFFAPAETQAAHAPRFDVWEDDAGYHIEAELPGFAMDEIELFVHDDELSLEATHASEDDGDRDRIWHHRERTRRCYRRSLRLPKSVDADRVEARLESGVLHIDLPTKADAKPRRIAVKKK